MQHSPSRRRFFAPRAAMPQCRRLVQHPLGLFGRNERERRGQPSRQEQIVLGIGQGAETVCQVRDLAPGEEGAVLLEAGGNVRPLEGLLQNAVEASCGGEHRHVSPAEEAVHDGGSLSLPDRASLAPPGEQERRQFLREAAPRRGELFLLTVVPSRECVTGGCRGGLRFAGMRASAFRVVAAPLPGRTGGGAVFSGTLSAHRHEQCQGGRCAVVPEAGVRRGRIVSARHGGVRFSREGLSEGSQRAGAFFFGGFGIVGISGRRSAVLSLGGAERLVGKRHLRGTGEPFPPEESEEGVHRLQHARSAPEGGGEGHVAGGGSRLRGAVFQKGGAGSAPGGADVCREKAQVRVAEAIDGLLEVAHEKERVLSGAPEPPEEPVLQRIRVLKLVHENVPEAETCSRGSRLRSVSPVWCEGLAGEADEVVEGEHSRGGSGFVPGLPHQGGEAEEERAKGAFRFSQKGSGQENRRNLPVLAGLVAPLLERAPQHLLDAALCVALRRKFRQRSFEKGAEEARRARRR